MNKKTNSFKDRVPVITYNPELDKYSSIVLFPDKVAKAKEMLEKHGTPDLNKINQKKKEEA